MEKKKDKITTKTNIIISNVVALWEILVSLVLIISAISFGFKVGASSYGLFKNEFNKSEYVQSLINDEELDIITSENLKVIQSGEATDNEVIAYYWITNLNFIGVLVVVAIALEKARQFFKKNNIDSPFENASINLYKSLIRCLVFVIGIEIVCWLACTIFTPFEMEFLFDIGITEIIMIYFVYYLLRKGNELLKIKEEKNA